MIDNAHNLIESETPEKLLHDIATPLLITQMNADLLAKHLPELLRALLNLQPNGSDLLNDDARVNALINAPTQIKNNLATVQKKIRELTRALESIDLTAEKITHPRSENTTATTSVCRPSLKNIKTILLVEDEIIHQDIGLSLLSPQYQVDCANNGLEAVQKCKEKNYDLILMDLQMPKMNGVEATSELRKTINKNTIIIGLTSMPIGSKRNELVDIGFNNFLEKPLKLESFQNILRLHTVND